LSHGQRRAAQAFHRLPFTIPQHFQRRHVSKLTRFPHRFPPTFRAGMFHQPVDSAVAADGVADMLSH
jgi:hypothetical protein